MRLRRTKILCRQAVELMTDYLDDALPRSTRKAFVAHLRHCKHCHEYLEQIKATIRAIRTVEPNDLDDGVRTDLVAMYRRERGDPTDSLQ